MEWKDIKGYENLYQVSDTGLVRSTDRKISYSNNRINVHKGKLKKLQIRPKTGYVTINLYDLDKKYKQRYVHRLVAIAFVPNDDPENKTQVNHIDGNKENNAKSNVEWCTPLYNMRHARDNNLLSKCGLKNTLSLETVIIILDSLDSGIASRHIAKTLGLSAKTVARIRRGESYAFIPHPRNFLKSKI